MFFGKHDTVTLKASECMCGAARLDLGSAQSVPVKL